MQLRLLSASDVRTCLPMRQAIHVAAQAFVAQAEGRVRAPLRSTLTVKSRAGDDTHGVTLVMPAHLPDVGLATKVVSVFPGNTALGKAPVSGLVLVLDESSGEPKALIDGTFLTVWRTAAAVGAASECLARADVRVAAMLGAGAQGRAHVLAMDMVRDLTEIRIWSRTTERADQLVAGLAGSVRARLVRVTSPAEALAGAGLISCATPATEPLFAAACMEPGAHLNSVGSFTPSMVEVDPELARDATVFVDDPEAALQEAGELLRARDAGLTDPSTWIPLGAALSSAARGRQGPSERTWFKSVGLTVQDVTAAAAVLTAAEAQGLGNLVEL